MRNVLAPAPHPNFASRLYSATRVENFWAKPRGGDGK